MQNQKVPSLTFVNIIATYTELRYFEAERSARRLVQQEQQADALGLV
jgi:hypothetical protein